MMILLLPLLGLGCKKADDPVDLGDTADTLTVPDLTGIDMEGAIQDGLALALGLSTAPIWTGHANSLSLMQSGCPDLYVGAPDKDLDVDGGQSWADHCTTNGGLFWSGYAWWDADVSIGDTVDGAAGTDIEAERELMANGTVGDSDGGRFGFDGDASDALSSEESDGYTHWTYSSLVDGMVTGRDLFDDTSATPDGWRASMSLYYTGGDVTELDASGDAYFFDAVLQDRFDSVTLDLAWASPDSTAPDGCALEPAGYIGVRDQDAVWYDVVFQPLSTDDSSEDPYGDAAYAECDGCGTLYVRGIEQGTVCPDLSFVWDGRLAPPSAEDYVLTLHDQEAP